MGAAVEIRDIKIINQCLEVRRWGGAVYWCAFFLSASLSVFTSRSTSSFLPPSLSSLSSLSHALSAALSLEAPKGQSPQVSPAKVFLNAATTRVHPHRDNPGLSSGSRSGEYSAYA